MGTFMGCWFSSRETIYPVRRSPAAPVLILSIDTFHPETNCFLCPSVYVNIDVRTLYIKWPPLPSRTAILCASPLAAVTA